MLRVQRLAAWVRSRAASGTERLRLSVDGGPTYEPGASGDPSRTMRTSLGIPNVEFADLAEFEVLADHPTAIAGKYVKEAGPLGTIYLNKEWSVYRQSVDRLVAEKGHVYDADDLEKVVQTEYKTVALAKVAHAMAIGGALAPEDREQLVSWQAITTALAGFYAEENLINAGIGGLTKRRLKKLTA